MSHMEISEVRKHATVMLWQGWSTLDIVFELRQKFNIGESAERELEIQVARLRSQIKEARELAPGVAAQMLRDGYERAEINRRLEAPYLLSGFEVNGIVARALVEVQAEKAESEPEPVVSVMDNQQLIDAALSAHPHDPTLLSLCERIQTDRAAHEQVQERLQEERDERKARGIEQ